ncbi:HPP-domain-containing protein [Astrocystis sublimbata]|nr:HPP-domain-containing protein [Astrocystis sublimbata]
MQILSPAKRYVSWVPHWFGFRPNNTSTSTKQQGPPKIYVPYVWAFVGAFAGVAILQAIFGQSAYFIERGVPPLVASYGASAVLCFSAIEAPLAQPRAVIGGHFFSALTGVIFARIFSINNIAEHEYRLAWLAASLSTATAIVVMMLTKTLHPPAGATALLPILEPAINKLSWYLLPVVLLSSTVMVAVALLTNNVQRRYPTFWWSPNKPQPKTLPISEDMAKSHTQASSEERPTQDQRV